MTASSSILATGYAVKNQWEKANKTKDMDEIVCCGMSWSSSSHTPKRKQTGHH
jgi:hypothetical protein